MSSSNPVTLTVTSNKAITAKPTAKLHPDPQPDGHGVTGTPSNTPSGTISLPTAQW
ncbi:MAG: hypothetical protein U0175_35710 [Caldilineaceae bacterium]